MVSDGTVWFAEKFSLTRAATPKASGNVRPTFWRERVRIPLRKGVVSPPRVITLSRVEPDESVLFGFEDIR